MALLSMQEDADERLLPIPMQFDPSSVVYSMQGISKKSLSW